MPGPARAGVFIYAKDLERMARFYEAVLGMRQVHATGEIAVLESPDIQLVLHATPPQYAAGLAITSPPRLRENTALKFFFTVASIPQARERAAALGGNVQLQHWSGPGFVVCNANDPEGNVFQLRESATPA